jgi:predicted DNA repair protein MutK
MAAANLLALLDDIASVLDDVAAFSKLAAKKTAGVLGDDLALNAQQVSGVQASRELPVIWAVARGSFVNKAVLVPAALVISAFAPMLVTPLLMVGGTYLCYEGFEKVAHRLLHRGTGDGEHAGNEGEQAEAVTARVPAEPAADPMVLERNKIRGAIRTDFILSAEIIIIALGTVAAAPLLTRIGVLTAVAVLMTVAVYGFVAAGRPAGRTGGGDTARDGAATDADAHRGGHGGDVPGGRRYHGARRAGAPPRTGGADRAARSPGRRPRRHGRQRPGRGGGRRHRPGGRGPDHPGAPGPGPLSLAANAQGRTVALTGNGRKPKNPPARPGESVPGRSVA